MFEIEVIDKRNNELDYIIFDISIDKDKFIAQHVALNELHEQINEIPFCSIDIDEDFSLDENLNELYEECINALLRSTFYELK